MKANTLRALYLDFFKSKQHKIVSSAPMVVKNDPTLMFANAGMNQFKDIFLGDSDPKDLRIANVYLMPLGGENKNKIIEEIKE